MIKRLFLITLVALLALGFVPIAQGGVRYDDGEIVIDDTNLYPKTDGGSTLGKVGNEFAALYVDNVVTAKVNSASATTVTDTKATITTAEGGSTFIATSAAQGGKHFDLPSITAANNGLMYTFMMGGPTIDSAGAAIIINIEPQDDSAIVFTSKGTDGASIETNTISADCYPTITLKAFASDWYVVDYKGTWAAGS